MRPVRAPGPIRVMDTIRYVSGVPVLRRSLGSMAIVGTFTLEMSVTLPLISSDTFGGDGRVKKHESVNRTARDTERLPCCDVDRFSVDGPCQDPLEAVNGLLVMIVTVSGRRQTLPSADRELEHGDVLLLAPNRVGILVARPLR